MRIRSVLVGLVLVGCGSETSAPSRQPTAPARAGSPVKEAPTPTETLTPAPTSTSGASAGAVLTAAAKNCAPAAVTVPAAGTSIAFQVDTRSLRRAHLAASGRTAADGDPSPLTLALREASTKVRDGWDVCVGQGPTSCFANLEIDPGLAQRSFVLDVAPRAGTSIDATITICVIDPLDTR